MKCSCNKKRTCIAAAGLNEDVYKPVINADGTRELPFHVRILPPKECAKMAADFGEGFNVVKIVQVINPETYDKFKAQQRLMAKTNGGIIPHEAITYHTPKTEDIEKICALGLEYRIAQRGFFGKGIYSTPDPMKANDYSDKKGNPEAVRAMLRCQVTVGRTKEFDIGRFDRDLYMEPEGYDSTKGFIRRASEYVVYNSDRINVTHIVFYKFGDSVLELTPSTALPPNVTGQIVYITASLSEFFGKLQQRAGPPTCLEYVAIRRLIGQLLKSQLSVDAFMAEVSKVLKAVPPADLGDRMRTELAKCRLPPPQTAAVIMAPNPDVPPVDAVMPAPGDVPPPPTFDPQGAWSDVGIPTNKRALEEVA